MKHYDENQRERRALKDNLDELGMLMKFGAYPEKLRENDLEFHRLLGKASCNLLAERIYNFVIDFMDHPSRQRISISMEALSIRYTRIL